jgi:hypothetical protein
MNLADLSVGANPEGRISITAGTTARGRMPPGPQTYERPGFPGLS